MMRGERRSPGGYVVADSLAAAGFNANRHPDVSLVETAAPSTKALNTVVCQNAWNFLTRSRFRDLACDYPLKSRVLYRARRAIATTNVIRARRRVVLTQAMADLLAGRGLSAAVAPVTIPHDIASGLRGVAPDWVSGMSDFVLVPGTLTWYKDPHRALELLRDLPGTSTWVIFAGTDDGSGCQNSVARAAAEAGFRFEIRPVGRAEMRWLLERASMTVLPSHLESLSFSLAEALLASPNVVASPLPVHREVAHRMRRTPAWLTTDSNALASDLLAGRHDPLDPGRRMESFLEEWRHLAEELAS